MRNIIIVLLSCALIFFICVPIVYSVQPQTSFELFWPVTAGKTADESWYKLKRWKENLRGVLILGKVQRANYEVELGIKRLLEAEKLISKNRKDLALKNIEEADFEFISATSNINNAKLEGEKTRVFADDVKPRLEKVLFLLKMLPPEQGLPFSDKYQKLKKSVDNLLSELK